MAEWRENLPVIAVPHTARCGGKYLDCREGFDRSDMFTVRGQDYEVRLPSCQIYEAHSWGGSPPKMMAEHIAQHFGIEVWHIKDAESFIERHFWAKPDSWQERPPTQARFIAQEVVSRRDAPWVVYESPHTKYFDADLLKQAFPEPSVCVICGQTGNGFEFRKPDPICGSTCLDAYETRRAEEQMKWERRLLREARERQWIRRAKRSLQMVRSELRSRR